MIKNKNDLEYFLNEDKKALGIKRKKPKLFNENLIWKFQIILRKHEYYNNLEKKKFLQKILCKIYSYRHRRLGIKLGFSIPINVFDSGLRINHYGLIVINPKVRIGKNCDIHQGVNIGQGNSSNDIPKIGKNVFIGPGVKIFGEIEIGDNIAIGANSVVNKSFKEKNITIANAPARKIKDNGTKNMKVCNNW